MEGATSELIELIKVQPPPLACCTSTCAAVICEAATHALGASALWCEWLPVVACRRDPEGAKTSHWCE